jgi:hypothetical protein
MEDIRQQRELGPKYRKPTDLRIKYNCSVALTEKDYANIVSMAKKMKQQVDQEKAVRKRSAERKERQRKGALPSFVTQGLHTDSKFESEKKGVKRFKQKSKGDLNEMDKKIKQHNAQYEMEEAED